MVYARMSTTSLSSHIVLRHLGVCIYICIYIYINLTGVVAQGGSNFLHAFQWVVVLSDTVCRIPKITLYNTVKSLCVCDGCEGPPFGAPMHSKCANLWAGLIFSSFFVQSTSTTGRFRKNPRPAGA